MTEAGYAVQRSSPIALPLQRASSRRLLTAAALWAIGGGNAALIVWLWVHGGNVSEVQSTGELLTGVGRLTGLLAAYAALLQVLLLAWIRWLERLVGFDRLTVWHRWNGHACLDLVLAHVVLTVWGYALIDKISLPKEISTMLGGGIYPGMITATIGTALLIGVVVSSVVIVRRRLRYEAWYAVHLAAYAAIALAWFHQIPTGNELACDRLAADYWRALYVATLALIVGFRVLAPLAKSVRHGLRVAEVVQEAPGVVSVHITGRGLDRLDARAGQFFLWRFLDRRRWWSSHPFSLSAAPDGRSLRITVKALGDFTSRLAGLEPGTRLIAEGPFGVFTEASRKRERVLLVAGGIGITPIRALMEDMHGDVVVIYRVVDESDIVFREELERLARERGLTLRFVVGDHATPVGRRLLSPRHLRELVPDITERQVYICGPPAMTSALERNVRRATFPPALSTPRSSPSNERTQMRRAITISLTSAVLALPVADAAAAATRAKVVIRKFSGAAYQVDHYGPVKVVITVKKTTIGKKVTRRITAVSVPVYPNSSGRSAYISENAIPILLSEALRAQSANIDLVSGATDLSEAFINSLQSAILKAKRA